MAKKMRMDVLYLKRLFVGGAEIAPAAGADPPILPTLEDSKAQTLKALRADYNDLLDVLRLAGVVG